jgi:acyl-CoA thioesterase-1
MLISRSWFVLMMATALLQPWSLATSAASTQPVLQPVILVVGDSLSAGYGVAVDATWVALLQRQLAQQGYGYRIVNASVSGETTGGARPRLARALQLHKPAIVIIELGGNDGLRGLPLRQVGDNLADMLTQSQAVGSKALLIGMRIPPNYGPAYAEQFHSMYSALAEKFNVPVLDFFLEGVAQDEKLMQADGIHPNAQAQPRLVQNLWPVLQPLLKK